MALVCSTAPPAQQHRSLARQEARGIPPTWTNLNPSPNPNQGCVYYPVYEAVQSCRPRELRRDLRRTVDRQVARLPWLLQAAMPWQAGVPGAG